MVYVQLKNENYIALMGELYIQHFKEFVKENVINLDAIDLIPNLKRRYELRKLFFNYLCDSLTLLNDQGDPVPEFGGEISNICKRMSSVGSLVPFLADQGKYEVAINQMDGLISDILKLTNRMLADKKKL